MNKMPFEFAVALTAIFFLLMVVAQWVLYRKAGYSGLWSLLMFIPGAGLIGFILLPFLDWPSLKAAKAAKITEAKSEELSAKVNSLKDELKALKKASQVNLNPNNPLDINQVLIEEGIDFSINVVQGKRIYKLSSDNDTRHEFTVDLVLDSNNNSSLFQLDYSFYMEEGLPEDEMVELLEESDAEGFWSILKDDDNEPAVYLECSRVISAYVPKEDFLSAINRVAEKAGQIHSVG